MDRVGENSLGIDIDFPIFTEAQVETVMCPDGYLESLPSGEDALKAYPATTTPGMECLQDTLPEGERFVSSHPRGFVFTPADLELTALMHDGPDTFRYAQTRVIDMYDMSNRLRGCEIIPNLVVQLRKIQEAMVAAGQRYASYVDIHEGALTIVVYSLSEYPGAYIIKHYIHPKSAGKHETVAVMLDRHGELHIPRFNEHGSATAFRKKMDDFISDTEGDRCYAARSTLMILQKAAEGDGPERAHILRWFPGVTLENIVAIHGEFSSQMVDVERACTARDAVTEAEEDRQAHEVLMNAVGDFFKNNCRTWWQCGHTGRR